MNKQEQQTFVSKLTEINDKTRVGKMSEAEHSIALKALFKENDFEGLVNAMGLAIWEQLGIDTQMNISLTSLIIDTLVKTRNGVMISEAQSE